MSKQGPRDQIYAAPQDALAAFRFDDKVAAVFTDMINRSVPGYGMILEMISVITRQYARANSRCYDLGCSLGASTLAIRHSLPDASSRIIAIDNSEAMVSRCRDNIALDDQRSDEAPKAPVEVQLADVRDVVIANASLVTLNFTLQFLAVEHREPLLRRICAGLNPGGVLILSEKIAFNDDDEQAVLTDLHHGFKRARGYSDLEIAQKRSALENVLVPESLQAHKARLLRAGFSQVSLWFQCFNFMSLLAIKA